MIQIGAPAATIDSPVEHLAACHRRIEQRLDGLVHAADSIATSPREARAGIERCLHFLDTSGVLHTQDEEQSLFPRLRTLADPAERAFLDQLEAQHVEADEIYCRLKRALARLDDDPAALDEYRHCATQLRALYREHIRAEDRTLRAIALRVLSAGDLAGITTEMRLRRASLLQ